MLARVAKDDPHGLAQRLVELRKADLEDRVAAVLQDPLDEIDLLRQLGHEERGDVRHGAGVVLAQAGQLGQDNRDVDRLLLQHRVDRARGVLDHRLQQCQGGRVPLP
eukprot:15450464-Alexandrium_andersonii.AAC.1